MRFYLLKKSRLQSYGFESSLNVHVAYRLLQPQRLRSTTSWLLSPSRMEMSGTFCWHSSAVGAQGEENEHAAFPTGIALTSAENETSNQNIWIGTEIRWLHQAKRFVFLSVWHDLLMQKCYSFWKFKYLFICLGFYVLGSPLNYAVWLFVRDNTLVYHNVSVYTAHLSKI